MGDVPKPENPFRIPALRGLGTGVLGLMATLNVLAALSLAATLFFVSPAGAQVSDCGGRDLMADMRATDPARYASVEAEAAQTPNGKSVFWKIDKDGLAPSYLLGTMHVTDPRVVGLPPGAGTAFAKAATVIVETDEIVDQRKATATVLMQPGLTMFPAGKTIYDFLDDGQEAELAAGLKRRGIILKLVARMKPWMLASFVSLPACEMSRKGAGSPFLDQKLAQDALAQGKALKGLETLVEQLHAMDDLPTDLMLKSLIQTLDLGETVTDVMETTTVLYLNGEVGTIMPMMKAISEEKFGEADPAYADFDQRIIIDRNQTMATRAKPLLERGGAFMAVGALHLPGKDGLVELLRAQGWKVTAMP